MLRRKHFCRHPSGPPSSASAAHLAGERKAREENASTVDAPISRQQLFDWKGSPAARAARATLARGPSTSSPCPSKYKSGPRVDHRNRVECTEEKIKSRRLGSSTRDRHMTVEAAREKEDNFRRGGGGVARNDRGTGQSWPSAGGGDDGWAAGRSPFHWIQTPAPTPK